MDMKNSKFLLALTVVLSLFLASCGSNDEKDQAEQDAAQAQQDADQAAKDAAAAAEAAAAEAAANAQSEEEQAAAALAAAQAAAGEQWDNLVAQGVMKTTYYFGFDDDSLTSEARESLDQIAQLMVKTGYKVTLEGHADERGTREYNLALSERRANSVRDYLIVQGVDGGQIEVVGYGEEKPEVAESNESAWAKNRRVQLVK